MRQDEESKMGNEEFEAEDDGLEWLDELDDDMPTIIGALPPEAQGEQTKADPDDESAEDHKDGEDAAEETFVGTIEQLASEKDTAQLEESESDRTEVTFTSTSSTGDLDQTLAESDVASTVPEQVLDEFPVPVDESNVLADEGTDEDDLSWLDKIASGQREAIEEPPTMSWDDEIEVPEDPDEAMAWLEKLAEEQSVQVEELPLIDGDAEVRPDVEIDMEHPDEEDVDDGSITEAVDSDIMTLLASAEDEFQRVDREHTTLDDPEGVAGKADEMVFAEFPEDPDEAMAWLERLAAQQGAPLEELPTLSGPIEDAVALTDEVSEVIEEQPAEAVFGELADVSLPADDDEALAWLEELAEVSDQSPAYSGEATDEAVTPATPADVMAARLEAERLFALPDSDQDLDEVDVIEEAEETLTWVDKIVPEATQLEDIAQADESQVPVEKDLSAEDDLEPPDWLLADALELEADSSVEQEEAISEAVVVEPAIPDDELTIAEAESDVLPEPEEAIEVAKEQEPEGIEEQLETLSVDPVISEDAELPVALQEEVDTEAQSEAVDEKYLDVEETTSEEEISIEELESGTADYERLVTDGLDIKFDEEPEEPIEDVGELEWLASEEIDAEGWLQGEEETADHVDVMDTTDMETVLPLAERERLSEEMLEVETDLEPALEFDQLRLGNARDAVAAGDIEEAVRRYTDLVTAGEGMPFLIADLESTADAHSDSLPLQRLLGDAYAQNGQLQKAIDTYRKALDQI